MALNSKKGLFDSNAVDGKSVRQPQRIQQYGDVFLIDLEMEGDDDEELSAIFSGQTSTQETTNMVASWKENGKLTEATGATKKKLCWVWPVETSSMGTSERESAQSVETGKSRIHNISWIWPKLGRKNAVCEEIEKSLYCDERLGSLNEKRRQLVMR